MNPRRLRTRMTRWLGGVVPLFCACIEDTPPLGDLKVGLLLPFTGGGAAAGQNYEIAARMVAERVNEAGGIGDGFAGKIEFVTYDTHGDLEQALHGVDRMITEGVRAIIGPESSEIALHMIPLLERERIVFVSPMISSGTQPDLTAENAWYRFGPSASVIGRAIAYDAIEQGAENMALLVSDDDNHSAIGEEFADRFTREGGVVVASISLPSNRPSFADRLSLIHNIDLDSVALIAPPKTAAQVVNEVAFLGHEQPLQYFLPPSLETEVFLQNTSPGAVEGARGVMPAISDTDQEFLAQFRAAAADDPLSGAYYYYDAMMVLALALSSAHHFRLEENSFGTVLPVPSEQPRTDVDYEDLLWFMRRVSERNGVRVGWNELETALSVIQDPSLPETERLVFYHGLTGIMVQDDNGQRNAAATVIWTIEGGHIERLTAESDALPRH